MDSTINTLFLCAHAALYIYVITIVYKKFIRPYLLQEQQQQKGIIVQLQERFSTVQNLMKAFKDRVTYVTQVFTKIASQQEHARILMAQCQTEQHQAEQVIQAEYEGQQQTVMHNRHMQRLYKDIAPQVMQELKIELLAYAQDHGKEYLKDAIKKLQEQSRQQGKI